MRTGHYARWRDEHDVVHWIEAQLNLRVYTSCRVLVETLAHSHARSSFTATWSHPTCLTCVAEAIPDVYENPY